VFATVFVPVFVTVTASVPVRLSVPVFVPVRLSVRLFVPVRLSGPMFVFVTVTASVTVRLHRQEHPPYSSSAPPMRFDWHSRRRSRLVAYRALTAAWPTAVRSLEAPHRSLDGICEATVHAIVLVSFRAHHRRATLSRYAEPKLRR
jgi:hypothetical protein